MDDASSVANFVRIARGYCDWCLSPRTSDSRTLHTEAIRWLAQLYAAALDLPDWWADEDVDNPEIPKELRRTVSKSFAALPFHDYRVVFDPSIESSEEPVVGNLSDDLTDIFIDLKRGLVLLDQGHDHQGVWYWRLMFSHWGRHATSALSALQCYEFPEEQARGAL